MRLIEKDSRRLQSDSSSHQNHDPEEAARELQNHTLAKHRIHARCKFDEDHEKVIVVMSKSFTRAFVTIDVAKNPDSNQERSGILVTLTLEDRSAIRSIDHKYLVDFRILNQGNTRCLNE